MIQGEQPVDVRIGYVYGGMYTVPVDFATGFGAWSSDGSPVSVRRQVSLWKPWRGTLGQVVALPLGLGGWTLSAHHIYDPIGRVLHFGDGRRRRADALASVIATVAGSGCGGCTLGDGGPAAQASLDTPSGVAIGPDGSVYISDTFHHRVRRVALDKTISTFAGTGVAGGAGNGGPATQAQLHVPRGLALAPDGSLYIAEQGGNRIRRVGPDGVITTVAGTGAYGYGGDNGPATQAMLRAPFSLAVALDGTLFIADSNNHRIRRVGTDGVITTVVGDGVYGYAGDNGPAALARLWEPRGVVAVPDGGILVVDHNNQRIRRVDPTGIITTVAGTGAQGFAGDEGPATLAELHNPTAAALGPDGTLYIADAVGYRLRTVGWDGIIRSIAGTGALYGAIREGVIAGGAEIGAVGQIAVGPDTGIYVAETHPVVNRVRRIAPPPLPGVGASEVAIPSEDGQEAYVFTGLGKHLRTLDTRTGATIQEMIYDGAGRLLGIEDADGDMTAIARDSAGNPVAIQGPFGQTTQLSVNADGYLETVTNPANEKVTLSYGAEGLLTGMMDALHREHTFTYDPTGRLLKDEDPANGSKSLTRTAVPGGHSVTVTTALGRATIYSRQGAGMQALGRAIGLPNGLTGASVVGPGGQVTTTVPDGRVLTSMPGPDPRFGMLAPFLKAETLTTPGGRVLSIARSRTASLLDPQDLLSFAAITETTTVNGKSFLDVFTKSTRTLTRTTPEGRQLTMTLDSLGRVVQLAVPGVLPVELSYDAHGRLETIAQGPRTATRAYRPDGFLDSITDPLDQVEVYTPDAVGRVLEVLRPDGETVALEYDAVGNVKWVTPPGRPAHGFGYTPVDQRSLYDPPPLAGGPTPTSWGYDLDRKLAEVTRPDGVTMTYVPDPAGRLSAITCPGGQVTRSYDPATGKLTGLRGRPVLHWRSAMMAICSRTWTRGGTICRAHGSRTWAGRRSPGVTQRAIPRRPRTPLDVRAASTVMRSDADGPYSSRPSSPGTISAGADRSADLLQSDAPPSGGHSTHSRRSPRATGRTYGALVVMDAATASPLPASSGSPTTRS
jgi:YD repeat-containing protein